MAPQIRINGLLIVALSVLMSLVLRVSAETTICKFPAVFNFGDSNSDTGGLSAAFGVARPPNGQTFFNRPAGRFCDGRLVIDFMVQSLGLPFLNAYLDALASNFTRGANFATAGSTIKPQNTTLNEEGGFSPFSLNVQHVQFDSFHRRSQFIRNQQGSVYKKLLPTSEDISRALYTFDISQNDLTAAFFRNLTVDQVKDYVPVLLDQYKTIIKGIYNNQGGRSFWIHNTGPLGCLAYMLVRFPVTGSQLDRAGCAIPYNEVSQFFNQGLKEVVVQLRKELPKAAITYVDIYSVKYHLISHAEQYGFKQPLRVCCGYGGKLYNFDINIFCGATMMVNNKEVMIGKSCTNPSRAINWDGAHYTEAANKWMFDKIVDGSYSDPPIPLKMACQRQ